MNQIITNSLKHPATGNSRRNFSLFLVIAALSFIVLQSYSKARMPITNTIFEYNAQQLFERGFDAYIHDSIDEAVAYFAILTEKYHQKGSLEDKKFAVEALSMIGQINQAYENNYVGAFQYYSQSLDMAKEIGFREFMPNILLNIGNLFNLYDFLFPLDSTNNSCRQLYRESFDIAREVKNWDMACAAYINLLMLDIPFRINTELNHEMSLLLRDSIPPSVDDWALSLKLMESTSMIAQGDYKNAINYINGYKDSLINSRAAARDLYLSYLCLETAFIADNKIDSAIYYANKTLDLRSEENLDDIYMESYFLLADYYKKLNQQPLYEKYTILFYEAKDKLISHIVELEPTRISLELDKVKGETNKLMAEKQKQLFISIAIIIVLAIGIFIALVIIRKNRELAHKNLLLYNNMQKRLLQLTKNEKASSQVNSVEKNPSEGQNLKDKSLVSDDSHVPEDIPSEKDVTNVKYKSSSLNDDKRLDLIDKINDILNNSQEIYNSGFTLHDLSEMIGTNTAYLSQAINEHYGISFVTLLNKFKVEEVCKRMQDRENYANLTIDAIRESVGFKSRASFINAFKQNVGMLPSEYMQILKQEQFNSQS